MAIVLSDNIQTNAPKAADSRYMDNLEPYSSTTEVNSCIAAGVRYTGLTVNVSGTEYWYKEGITDPDLIEKESGGGTIIGGTNGLSTAGVNVVLGGDLTGSTSIGIINTTTLTVTDANGSPVGIQYGGDYKGTFNNCSLITKEYADACDAVVSASTLSAANSYTDTCVAACGGGIAMSGSTVGGITTYVDANTICANTGLTLVGGDFNNVGSLDDDMEIRVVNNESTGESARATVIAQTLSGADLGMFTYASGHTGTFWSESTSGTSLLWAGTTTKKLLIGTHTGDAPVKIFHGGACKFNTTSTGVCVTGVMDSSGVTVEQNIEFPSPSTVAKYICGMPSTTPSSLVVAAGGSTDASEGGHMYLRGGSNASTGFGGDVCICGGSAANATCCGCVTMDGYCTTICGRQDSALHIRSTTHNPYLSFYCSDGITRIGYIRGCGTNCAVVTCADNGSSLCLDDTATYLQSCGALYLRSPGSAYLCGSAAYLCGSASSRMYGGTDLQVYALANSCVSLRYNAIEKFKTVTNGICVPGINCGFACDWVATSDCRLKINVIPISNALSMVNCLCGVCYNDINDEKNEGRIGLIAQEVEEVIPEIVAHSDAGKEDEKYGITGDKLGLKYGKLTAVLVEAVKELRDQNICLQNQITSLRNEIRK